MKLKKCARILRSIFKWLLIVLGGLWGVVSLICAFAALFGGLEINTFGERVALFATFLVMAVGFFAILRLGIRLKNGGKKMMADSVKNDVTRKSMEKHNARKAAKKSVPKEDIDHEQEITAERAEMLKMYQDFVNGEGRLPEGFSEKYNRTTQSGYVLHETPFKEYLDKIRIRIDSLKDRTGISDWIFFDGHIEINTAIEMITDWVRRHRKMNDHLCKSKDTFGLLGHHFYCEHKIMIVMENGDAFRNVTEKSIASCKAEQISFCTILSECELYDLIEHKAKTIKYTTYPNYHDETYADWWLEDSPVTQKKGGSSGRPEGPISVICQLSDECNKDGAFYSFEQQTREVTLVKNQTHYFVCVREYSCAAEANGRPVSSHTEYYYTVTASNADGITADNWKENVVRPPAYVCHRVSEGIV